MEIFQVSPRHNSDGLAAIGISIVACILSLYIPTIVSLIPAS
jgi:hypothetical protein